MLPFIEESQLFFGWASDTWASGISAATSRQWHGWRPSAGLGWSLLSLLFWPRVWECFQDSPTGDLSNASFPPRHSELWHHAPYFLLRPQGYRQSALAAQSCPTRLLCLWNSPARILERVAMPSSRGSSWPRDRTWITHISGSIFPIWATNKTISKCETLKPGQLSHSCIQGGFVLNKLLQLQSLQ